MAIAFKVNFLYDRITFSFCSNFKPTSNNCSVAQSNCPSNDCIFFCIVRTYIQESKKELINFIAKILLIFNSILKDQVENFVIEFPFTCSSYLSAMSLFFLNSSSNTAVLARASDVAWDNDNILLLIESIVKKTNNLNLCFKGYKDFNYFV